MFYEIENKVILVRIIDENGNIKNKSINKSVIYADTFTQVTKDYFSIKDLGNDHFAVCDLVCDYNIMDKNCYELNDGMPIKFKWGIIRINRDDENRIIPMKETLVIPVVYDKISGNNLKVATVYNNSKLSYIDIDVDSSYYGKQLVPCVLQHAVPFSTFYDGFAECSVNNITGYLPRNCIPREEISGHDLLTNNQMYHLYGYLNGTKGIKIGGKTIDKYFNLTGEMPVEENIKKLRKVYNME